MNKFRKLGLIDHNGGIETTVHCRMSFCATSRRLKPLSAFRLRFAVSKAQATYVVNYARPFMIGFQTNDRCI